MLQMTEKRKEVEYAYADICSIMSNDEMWETLLSHIDTYKAELEKELNYEISFFDAAYAYHQNIFTPLMYELDNSIVKLIFRKKSLGTLILEVSAHWFSMMKEDKNVFADIAVNDYLYNISRNRITRFILRDTNRGGGFRPTTQAA